MSSKMARAELLSAAAQPIRDRVARDREAAKEPLRSALRYIGEHFDEQGLNAKRVFEIAGVRGKSAWDRFRQLVGTSPREYLESCRFEFALRLMQRAPWLPLAAVAAAVGYAGESGFHQAVRSRFGRTAGDIRAQLEEGVVSVGDLISSVFGLEVRCDTDKSGSAKPVDRNVEEFLCEILWRAVELSEESEFRELIGLGFRFSTPAPIRFLMEKSTEACRDDRRLGLRLASLAIDLLRDLRGQISKSEHKELKIEALVNLANTYRLTADLDSARVTIAEAERELEPAEAASSLQALVYLYKGHICTYQRRFQEALRALSVAHDIYVEVRNTKQVIKTLSAIGYSLVLQDRGNDAIEAYSEALALANPLCQKEPYLLYAIHSGLAASYSRVGSPTLALEHLDDATRYGGQMGSSSIQSYLDWQKGLCLGGTRQTQEAEILLGESLKGLKSAGDLGNAALVALDLARNYLARGQLKDGENLALEALPMLQTLHLDSESATTLRAFAQAVLSETLSVESLCDLRRMLQIQTGAPPI